MRTRPLLQKGRGIASFFSSIARFLIPLFRKGIPVAKAIMKTPAGKTGLKKLKKAALKTAINTSGGILSGDGPRKTGQKLKKDLKNIAKAAAKSSVKIGAELISKKKKAKKKNGKMKNRQSIFK